ncbi:MAG: S41 family peptidase, partial [Saprospiraceae bacterium]
AINVCNVFIPKGEEVVVTRGKVKDWDRSFRTLNAPVDEEVRLVVLIDNNSASASEIVSGVIQDLDRGVLIGQLSYGKGLVQNTRDVGYNSKVKLTTAKYYIPSGRCIQAVQYKNGEPVDVPLSERAAFKTNNGRKVYDGGGVQPDMELMDDKLSNVLRGLDRENLIFNYATSYQTKNKSITEPEKFKFTNYVEFMNFVANESFSFDTDTEKMLKDLEAKAKEDGYMSLVSSDINNIRNKILTGKKNDLKKYEKEITRSLEKEIVGRYHYRKGQIEIGLRNDAEIKEAIKLLNDKVSYEKLLK